LTAVTIASYIWYLFIEKEEWEKKITCWHNVETALILMIDPSKKEKTIIKVEVAKEYPDDDNIFFIFSSNESWNN